MNGGLYDQFKQNTKTHSTNKVITIDTTLLHKNVFLSNLQKTIKLQNCLFHKTNIFFLNDRRHKQ